MTKSYCLLKFLLLNQTFYPDVASTAQHLADLAEALAGRGHEVTVVASRRAYDEPAKTFPSTETWRGIRIERVATTSFGKKAKWRRTVDFASFIVTSCWRLFFVTKPDVVVALTSPPLISFIGAVYAKLCEAKFVYWVMDLNPDEAIAAGWLRDESLVARLLHALSRFSLRQANCIIALDRFMRTRIEGKGIDAGKILVLPPWSHEDTVRFDVTGRHRFREAHGLVEKFVVMYSGNHSPCHPLNTLMNAARALAKDPEFAFLFVGGGSEFPNVKQVVTREKLRNVTCLPYQPLEELAASLSAADLHVVVMGEAFVGLIHPCKIYNVLAVGAPVLCIGPSPSHLTEILGALTSSVSATVAHGEVSDCIAAIQRIRAQGRRGEPERYGPSSSQFAQSKLVSRLVAVLEQV